MNYRLFVFIVGIMLGLTATSLVKAEDGTVDVLTFENGEAKTTTMTKDEVNANYVPIGPTIHIDVDQKKAEENFSAAEEYFSEGINFLKNGEFSKALDAFLAADKLHPGEATIYNGLGMAYQKTGDNDRALQYFQKALEIKPDSSECLVNIAFYYYDLGNCDLALPYFKKALSLNSQMNGLSRYIDECSKKMSGQ
ncbi:MAG: tetratricopeptide repeat protein [Candidatus Omnitrophica bacterium]|nr:tetratricopeptide repeat protein [Candidatus Omnitrophota bacterium]